MSVPITDMRERQQISTQDLNISTTTTTTTNLSHTEETDRNYFLHRPGQTTQLPVTYVRNGQQYFFTQTRTNNTICNHVYKRGTTIPFSHKHRQPTILPLYKHRQATILLLLTQTHKHRQETILLLHKHRQETIVLLHKYKQATILILHRQETILLLRKH